MFKKLHDEAISIFVQLIDGSIKFDKPSRILACINLASALNDAPGEGLKNKSWKVKKLHEMKEAIINEDEKKENEDEDQAKLDVAILTNTINKQSDEINSLKAQLEEMTNRISILQIEKRKLEDSVKTTKMKADEEIESAYEELKVVYNKLEQDRK